MSVRSFRKGDVVAYCPGYATECIGRVAGPANDLNTFVCYTSGCTAAKTPISAAMAAEMGIGHHRFDEECPDYSEGCCAAYCPEKGGRR